MQRAIIPFVCALLLAGCVDDSIGLPPKSASSILASGWAVGKDEPTQDLYCYSTLADKECYATPQPGLEDRLITSGRPH